MTLATRLLLFYLGSLIVLLAGFSTTLYFVVQNYLQRQSNERLEAALNTLGAAAEVTPEGVEWEPNERTLRIVSGPEGDRIAWLVTDGEGRVVARSERPDSDDLLTEAAGRFRETTDDTKQLHWRGERWQAGQRCILPTGAAVLHEPKPVDPKEIRFPILVITTALPLDPTRAILRRLILVLALVSAGVLIIAALAGRSVCRRALRPVQNMAADARMVDPSDPDRRIALPSSGDELNDLGLAFNGLIDRLQESSERQRRFTGDASHQLRTPLAALMGQIEIALRRERTTDQYRDVLNGAHSNAARLQRIIESLLYLTRADSEALLPDSQTFDLARWLREHLLTWSQHARYADIRIAGSEAPIPVTSHPILLGELVNILLDNACRYSPAGSDITMTLIRMGSSVRLQVADGGMGISESDLTHLFTPFFRSSEALRVNKGGVGLGLSIARRLAAALGGSLSTTSRVAHGSCFAVSIPVAQGENPP